MTVTEPSLTLNVEPTRSPDPWTSSVRVSPDTTRMGNTSLVRPRPNDVSTPTVKLPTDRSSNALTTKDPSTVERKFVSMVCDTARFALDTGASNGVAYS